MRNFKFYCTIGLIAVVFSQCSEPEVIIPPLEVPTSGRSVLVEELTGVRCPNCPSASARLASIELLYGKNMVVVNIHGDLLTKPLPESNFDFRNEFASELEESFKPFIGKPSVVINRKKHPSFSLLANPLQDQWQSIVEDQLQLDQELTIFPEIIESDESYDLNIGFIPLVNLGGDYVYHVYLTENGIVDAQEDVDRIIPDYVHEHVLRYVFTPLAGTFLTNNFQKDELIAESISLSKSVFSREWVLDNMDVVIFVTNSDGSVVEVQKKGLK